MTARSTPRHSQPCSELAFPVPIYSIVEPALHGARCFSVSSDVEERRWDRVIRVDGEITIVTASFGDSEIFWRRRFGTEDVRWPSIAFHRT